VVAYAAGNDRVDEAPAARGRPRLLLDCLHGEDNDVYDKLVRLLSERCQVASLKKQALAVEALVENDVFALISPSKPWERAEVETVRSYVEDHGGILLAMTLEGRKPERLNELLEPYGLSVSSGTMGDKLVSGDSLRGDPSLLKGIGSLAFGDVWGYKSAMIATSGQVDVMLRSGDAVLGARRCVGKGVVYLFSCLPAFGNRQLDQAGNRGLLGNLLRCLGWRPSREDLEALIEDLKKAGNVGVLVQAAQALGEIGDAKAIEPLGMSVVSEGAALNDRMDWEHYHAMAPVVAEALTSIGKAGVEAVVGFLRREKHLLYGIPAVWALRKVAGAVVDWIFSVGPAPLSVPGSLGALLTYGDELLSPSDLMRRLVPPVVLPKLLGDYTDLVLDLFAWQAVSYSEAAGSLQFDLSRCSGAVRGLSRVKTPIANNLLHKASQVQKVGLSSSHGSFQSWEEYLDWRPNRDMAMEELARRGNPRYDPSAYLDEDAWRIVT
jgi:hypothetical protein